MGAGEYKQSIDDLGVGEAKQHLFGAGQLDLLPDLNAEEAVVTPSKTPDMMVTSSFSFL